MSRRRSLITQALVKGARVVSIDAGVQHKMLQTAQPGPCLGGDHQFPSDSRFAGALIDDERLYNRLAGSLQCRALKDMYKSQELFAGYGNCRIVCVTGSHIGYSARYFTK